MHNTYWVRYGSLGSLGRFATVDATGYPRGTRVVLRSEQGLQLGEVLAGDAQDDAEPQTRAGVILRAMTVEDSLLEARIEKHAEQALAACDARLAALGVSSVLVDVEPLFDGTTLVFYFLGERTPEVDQVLDDLAEAYESKAQFRAYAQALTDGCGPDCGSGDGGNCASCTSGCAIATACKPNTA